MKASAYGIKNLRRILPNLPEWTHEEGDKYENLMEIYREVDRAVWPVYGPCAEKM